MLLYNKSYDVDSKQKGYAFLAFTLYYVTIYINAIDFLCLIK